MAKSAIELEVDGRTVRISNPDLPEGMREAAAELGRDPLELAAGAGEDFELLFTAPPDKRDQIEQAAGLPVTWIGEVREGSGLRLLAAGGRALDISGYEHA
jgi:thiamine monophosphate kinase